MMQGLADGYFVLPYTIGDYLAEDIRTGAIANDTPEFLESEKAVKAQLDKFVSNNGTTPVDDYHRRLGRIMWDNCGMARNKEGLTQAIADI